MVGINACKNPANLDERLFISCIIDNYKYKSLVDSGAEICLIGIKNVRKNHNLNEITNAGINVTGIGGSVKVHGRINLKVNIGNEKSVFQSFVIVEDLANELLLGANFIKSNNFIIDMANEKLLERLNKVNKIAPKAINKLEPCNLNISNVKSAIEDTSVSDTDKCNINLINNSLRSKIVKETISNFNVKEVNNLNLENKMPNIDYTNGGVRLIETINLKPQHSTIAAFDLDKKFKNNVNVFSVGVFPDKAILNDNLMIQSCVRNSDCKNLVMPIMNCSVGMIQLKAGTIIAYAQKLVSKNNGELAEAGFEWRKKEVNASENKKNESFMEMFRMDEAKLTSDQNKKVEVLLNKFSKCISLSDNDVGKTSTLSHSIKLTRDTAIKQPIRRINGELAEEVETQLQQLSDDGIIIPSNSPWSSCIVPVKKRCGGLRLAIDYRLLNNLTVKDSFPLPNLNDAVYNLHGSVFLSTLDLTRGYYNVPMDEDSIPLTAFSTSRSHWEFIRMPFGLCNAGATFQRLMNLVLRGFSWSQCICYIDDALILGSTFEEHYNNLHDVLSCLSQHSLKIKPQKCYLFRKAVKFLGYEVSKNGIMPDRKNIEGITNFPRPTTVKNVRSFLGIVNFYRLHIPNCSIIQKPLSALTGKNKVLVWNDDAEKVFNKLKQLLVSPQLLAYPDYSSIEPLEVHVDSSLTGAGAVLSQKQLGVVRPIAFISTSWGVTEQNYASTARELAGLRWAVKTLAPFLRGREFVIHTDNQPLIFLSITKCVSQRLARTLEDLSDFNFKVKWIPGHSNIVADALSRMHETILDSPRAKESLNILGESLLEIKMDEGGDSLVNALSFWLTGNFSDSLNLRQKLVTELINNNKLYGLELNKVGKFELKIMLQEGINLIPEVIKAFSNLFNCKVIVFEKRRHPIEFGDDSLPKICYLNSHNSLHYNLLVESQVKPNKIIDPSPIILPEGRVGESVKNASVVINQSQIKLNFNKWTREEIQLMQRSNDLLRLLKTFISMYPPGDNRILKCKQAPNLNIFLKYINEIKIVDSILVREIDINLENHRFVSIITLDAFIKGAIEVHISRAHCGRQVLKTILRETVWNPNDWRVIEDVCHTCQICQRFKPPCNVAHPGFKRIVSACPFDLLSVDLMNLPITRDRFKCCLVAIDHFTKYLYAVPLKDKTAETVVYTLERVVFQGCLQLPSRILADNGPEWDNTLYRQMLIRNNIQPIYSSPNHPESNGGVERANQTLKNILARFEGEQVDWVTVLPEAVRIYNSSPHKTTQRTPVSFFLERAHSLRNNRENLLSAAWREPCHKFSPFMISQLIGKKIMHKGFLTQNKFEPRFEGPFQIVSVNDNDRSYIISSMVNETTPAFGKPIKVHHSHLRPWIPRPNYLAKFDRGGKIFQPVPHLNQVIPKFHYSRMYGNPSRMSTNSFLGFLPATPSVHPIAPGGNLAIPPIVESLVEPQNDTVGGNTPQGAPQPQPATEGEAASSTPLNLNIAPPRILESPIFGNLNSSGSDNNDPFEGFSLIDSSTERALSRMEDLLASPEIVNHSLPIIPPVAAEIINEPNVAEPNVIEIPPVASNEPTIIPEEVIMIPILVAIPIEPAIENTLPNTMRGVSRIPVLSPVLNPTITRLRT
ncbi:unnamed protein product [Rotaria magnacalcarata]|uniref:RNA-directed DNA polymerase n=1 Tax=Rotaria magnacalcarata TaxID=392030 RepID=A0A816ZLU8_9BILA|nr:unnamed protein product [Rotaria magnacalcarata]